MFEDQRGLRACHVGVGVQVLHHERAEIVGVTRGDVKDEVVGARQEVDVHHLRPAPDVLNEAADLAASVGLQADRDHRLQRQTERGRIDVSVKTTNHAEFLQPPDPAMTRRRGDADKLGQRAVGHPRVGVQGGQDAPIDVIDLDGPNILRRPCCPRPISSILLTSGDYIEEASK